MEDSASSDCKWDTPTVTPMHKFKCGFTRMGMALSAPLEHQWVPPEKAYTQLITNKPKQNLFIAINH